MAYKMYALVSELDATAPIYQRVTKTERVRLTKRPVDHPYLQQTFWDPEFDNGKDANGKEKPKGKNRTIRMKLNSNVIDQDVQIKEELILANEPFTQAERDAVKFKNGILYTDKPIVQKFLEAHPQFVDSKGVVDGISKMYFLLDKEKESRLTNEDTKRRVEAAYLIMHCEKETASKLMLILNGSFFTLPEKLIDMQNGLMDFLEDTNDAGVQKIIDYFSNGASADEEVNILLGELINDKYISFDVVKDNVVLIKDGKNTKLKQISSELDIDERKRYFVEFLTSESGALVLEDLKKLSASAKEASKPKMEKSK